MKISTLWLSDYIDLSGISLAELSELLSTRVAEVDSYWEVGAPLRDAVAARIVSTRPLEGSDKLIVVTIDLGSTKKEVVATKTNARDGLLVAYLPPGAKFFDGKGLATAGERDFNGTKSSGLLASARDLELFDDHHGLYELHDLPLGCSLEQFLGGVDSIIEIDNKSLTHRPDLWSHFGFAQELSAVLRRPLKRDLGLFADDTKQGEELFAPLKSGEKVVSITVRPETKLKRMIACRIDGLSAAQSPDWMKRRLFAIGAGVRNFLVDVSNYLMHDMGQPNHFFDSDRVGSALEIRCAFTGEKVTTLDEKERELFPEDLVIADEKRAIDIGAIMGGINTSVVDTTTSVIFTAGTWDPVVVRKSAQRHQLRTDAAQRYEKNLSPYLPAMSLQRLLQLLPMACPEAKIVGAVADEFPLKPEKRIVTLTAKLLQDRLGDGAPSFEEGCQILKNLRLRFLEEGAESCTVEIPHDRATKDLSIPEDLIEEIGRTWGYENIKESPPKVAATPSQITPLRRVEIELMEALRAIGFSEISNYSFTRPEYSESLGYSMADGVFMENPMDETQGAMRVSLVPGIIEKVIENAKFQTNLQIFEIGRAYFRSPVEKYKEYQTLDRFKNLAAHEKRLITFAILVNSASSQASEPAIKAGAEFYAGVNLIKRLVALFTPEDVSLEALELSSLPWMHPYRSAKVSVKGLELGVVAELKPGLAQDIRGRVVICELECDTLLELSNSRKFRPISKFPYSLFEISVVAPARTPYTKLVKLVEEGVPSEFLKGIDLLDVYQGKPLPEDRKSVSIRITFGAADRTLSSSELTKLQEDLMSHIEKSSYALRR